MRTLLFSAAALLGAATISQAAIVQFQDGLSNAFVANYDGTSDTELVSHASYNNNNGGGANYMRSNQTRTWEENRALLRFDLSSLAGQTVTSATLKLSELTGGGDTIPFNVHQIAAANAGWVQGTTTIVSPAADGQSTWNHKIKPTVNWAGSAGLKTAGTDYVSTPVASGTYVTTDPSGTVLSLTLSASLIQSWIDSPTTNAGLLILTDVNSTVTYNRFASFATSEHATQAFRPLLEVDVVPEPAGVALLGLGALALRRRK